jgi:uncharacterized protein (TIGR00369 family)
VNTEVDHFAAAGRLRNKLARHPTAFQGFQASSKRLEAVVTRFDEETSTAHLTFEVPREDANFYGSTHGGVVATIVDDACSVAALCVVGAHSFMGTMELAVNYLKPLKVGAVRAEAQVVSRSRNTVYVEAALFGEKGLAVKARALIAIDMTRPIREEWVQE